MGRRHQNTLDRRLDDDEGYYEDDGWDEELFDEEERALGLRQRMIAVLGTSYGISILAHVALLLVLAAWVIATPIIKKEIRISTTLETPIKPYDPEVKKDTKTTPKIDAPKTDVQLMEIEETPPTEEPPLGRPDAASNKDMRNVSTSDAFGPAGGAAGRYGFPNGTARATGTGGSDASEDAVNAALLWLKRHQSPDGRWDADGWQSRCKGERCHGPGHDKGGSEFDVGLTALAVLAYMGHGNTHRYGTFKRTVHRAQRWLRGQQAADGTFGLHGVKHGGAYNHALATNALCELYAMTKDPFLKRPCERAVAYVLKAQNPQRGWKYRARSAKNDVSVTGWMVLALKTAFVAGLEVPKQAFLDANSYLEWATASDGITGYNEPGGASSVLTGQGDAFEALPVMTAVSALCRQFIGARKTEVRRSVVQVSRSLPRWSERTVNYYYWYYGSYALFQFGGPKWKAWNEAMLHAILPHQRSGGCADGSWDGAGEWCLAGGRVYATAINVLTLEIYYRYERGTSYFASARTGRH